MPVVIKNYDIGTVSLPEGIKIAPRHAQIVDDAVWAKLRESGRVQSLLKAGTKRGLVAVTPEAFIVERKAATGGLEFLNAVSASEALLFVKGVADKKLLAEIGKVVKYPAVKQYIKTALTPKKERKGKKKK